MVIIKNVILKHLFGFKSRYHPPPCTGLQHFEKDLITIINNVKFTNNESSFQKKLRADIAEIKNSRNIYVFADKTNVYRMPTSEHNELLKENVTKTYKKAPEKLRKSINLEAKSMATNLKLSNRIEKLAEAPAYITLKDHKENFRSKPLCRLINPSKNEIERISKIVSETINKKLLKELDFNQWMNTDDVIRWFRNIPNKSKYKFIQLDIKEFYPSITKKSLNNAITFVVNYIPVSKEDIRIKKHCRKSLLFCGNEAWKKKDADTTFDVTMGSYDGAELCKLIGIYIQSLLTNILSKDNMGLYRDDGLFILRKINKQQADRVRKKIISIFKNIDFKIEIVTNLTEVDFLDVTFNLENNTYRPYKKPNDKLIYIDVSSNHPPQIKKQLTKIISDRLSRNSSNADIFNNTKLEYEEALKKCGHTTKLTYTPPNHEQNNVRRKRQRKIIWFNPPFNLDVSTNVAKIFLNLIEKHFPLLPCKLHKIFNKNTVKAVLKTCDK